MVSALQSRDVIELLSNKWRIPILHVLTPGPRRANDLHRAVKTVSAKVLTETLRGMERDGLIERHARDAASKHVEYSLTDMGAQAVVLLKPLCHWAQANAKHRDEARARFDRRRATKSSAGAPRRR